MPDLSIIIPTFNERGNIRDTIESIRRSLEFYNLDGEIIVVDDNSPDNTAGFARASGAKVIVRTSDKGLSQSVVEGFANATSDIMIVMDADGSHPTKCVYRLYREIINGADIAIGSRYTTGGEIKKWPLLRRIVSQGATILARVLFPDVEDPVSGIFAINRSVIAGIELRPSGYKILTEILGKGSYHNVVEIPYRFVNRKRGSSKLGLQQIIEYVIQILDIVVYAMANQETRVWKEIVRATRFAVVGVSGIFVNLISLYILVDGVGANLILAGFLAIELSIVTNFIFNDRWTFSDMRKQKPMRRLYLFHYVSFIGMVLNIAILGILAFLGVWYIAAELVGIVAAFSWNFLMNRRKTWN